MNRVRRRSVGVIAGLTLLLAGFGATIALGVGETTGTNTVTATACADASVPDRTFTGPAHSLSRDGGSIYTEPGDVVTAPGATDHQCQTATNVQTYTIPTVTVTTGTAPSYYVYAPMDGSIASPPWSWEASAPQGNGTPTGTYSWISDGFAAGAIRLHTPASPSWSSTTSQLASWYVGNNSTSAHATEGATTWYRFHVRVSANSFIPGEWDWLGEWHNNATTVPGPVSSAWGLVSSGSLSGPNPGTSPLLEFRAAGGPSNAPVYTRYKMAAGSFTAGVWHDLVAQITWGVNSTAGAVSLWVDGQPFPGYAWPQHVPTLFYNSSNNVRDTPAYGVYNYHYQVTFPTDRDYDEVLSGPTAASVNFTP